MSRTSGWIAAACGAGLLLTASGASTSQAQGPALSGTSPIYGYQPLEPHYGPIEAQRELENLTYQPEVHGLDYGYGVGYFFGFGPPQQYRAPTLQGKQKPARRGLIDTRWSSGYVACGHGPHAHGYFAVHAGCNCLTPAEYRSFATLVVPERAADQVGGSWYTGNPRASAMPPTSAVSDGPQAQADTRIEPTGSPDELPSRALDYDAE